MGSVKGQTKNKWKNEANIETFTNMVVLGCSVPDIVKEIGFVRQTYYQWIEDENILKEIDRRRQIVHTEGQAFIRSRYKKYLSNIDELCNDKTDKRTCLSANIYLIDRVDGKANANIDVNVVDTTDTIDTAKDLLKKYNAQLIDASDSIESDEPNDVVDVNVVE